MSHRDPQPPAAEDRPRVGSVLVVSVALSLGFLAFGLAAPDRLTHALEAVRRFVVGTFGLGYVVIVFALLPFLLLLAVTPFGRTRLGGPQDRPEFGWVSWIAMLLSAGVGLSFLFWGTAEPLIHFADPPQGSDVAGTEEAVRTGLRYSFLFWGLHAWATYGVVAVAVGYAGFRSGRSMLVSSALHPLLGDRVDGVAGHVVDVVAVFAILFGVATSLGLGTRELNASLADQFGVSESYAVQVAIIVGLMTVSTISALTGLGRGIRVLSLANIVLCGALLLFVLAAGPTGYLVATAGGSLAGYVAHFVPMSLAAESAGDGWEQEWTYFFWAWWISWSPFVGTFVARISRGRTIRSVVAGVVVVPSVVSVVWFSVFGGTALQRERSGVVDVAGTAAESKAVATFAVLGTLPLTAIVSVVVVAVLALLFITSADSASFMLGSTTSGGSMKPPRSLRLMWSFSAAFAAVLLLGGGTTSLQGAAVVAAVPFALILVCLCAALTIVAVRDRRPRMRAPGDGADRP